MATAMKGSVKCEVRVDKDLGDSWAVSVYPPAGLGPASAPMVVKLQGNDREKVVKGALEILQKAGKIDAFEV